MSKKIEVNIPNKVFYSLIAFVAIIILGVGVYAYGTNSPATFGHTISEVTPPQYCGGTNYNDGWLRYDGSKWICTDAPSGPSGISTPVTCTGTNKGLQWTGSAWKCVTFVSSDSACTWTGWSNVCGGAYCQEDGSLAPSSCSNDPAAYTSTSNYCSSGIITQSKTVTCCPGHGGSCQAAQL